MEQPARSSHLREVDPLFKKLRRKERRALYPRENLLVFWRRRLLDFAHMFVGYAKLALEMEEVWLQTRPRSPLEAQVVSELVRLKTRAKQWRDLRAAELEELYQRAGAQLEKSSGSIRRAKIRIPSRFLLWFKKWNVFFDSLTFTRSPMNTFWNEVGARFKRGHIHKIPIFHIVVMGFRESVLLGRLLLSVASRTLPVVFQH